MKAIQIAFVSLLVVYTSVAYSDIDGQISCRGSDGPHPLLNITHQFKGQPRVINTPGNVLDFLYWHGKDAVVVNNEFSQVFEKRLKNSKTRFISQLKHKMSRVTDPGERVILTDRDSWYLDSEETGSTWKQFNASQAVKHLYWHREGLLGRPNLYSITGVAPVNGIQKINLLSYKFGQENPNFCTLKVEEGEMYQLGEGHYYPNVLLYKIKNEGGISNVSLYELQVTDIFLGGSRCDVKFIKTVPQGIPGDVKRVYQFSDRRTFAVISKNGDDTFEVVWDSPKNELVCNFGERMPVVANTKLPALFSWQQGRGIRILFPDSESEAKILQNLSPCSSKLEDIWLANDGEKMLVRAFNEKFEKKLFTYSLDH